MTRSVFPELTLDRGRVRWEEHLGTPTPVEALRGRWYKREDYFAPLGYGGINGSKLRQLIWLLSEYRRQGGSAGVITGASVLSPQLSMAALCARHFDLPIEIVLGGTRPDTAIRHENVAIAALAGAQFTYARVGYNPTLQRAVARMSESDGCRGYYRLHYGITTPDQADAQAVARFHHVGAFQVSNVPPQVEHLIMPAGSCNSCVSVLLGVALYRPQSLRRITLIGIGPTRLDWIERRLSQIAEATGIDAGALLRPRFHDHPDLEASMFNHSGPIELEHFDLHSTRRFTYQDRARADLDGIDFHPTYEAKCVTFMREQHDAFQGFWAGDGKALFWIVGSQPRAEVVARTLRSES